MNIFQFLKTLVDASGSDLYISAGIMPTIRVEGSIRAITSEVITPENAKLMIEEILTADQLKEFNENLELNIALHEVGIGRFRVNIFMQRGGFALVARHVKDEVPTIEGLGIPAKLKDMIEEKRGLILVVGATGTGKSTSLAAMIGHRARTSAGHILSIEDPIEFLHVHSKSIVNQREVGVDTHSYEAALKNALREAPDVIMIGEIRDAQTMRHALSYAETGHLCVSTLHANSASQALDRIINFFTPDAHNQIRTDLSLFLNAIVAQNLCVGVDGKQLAIFEIMMNTPHIADLIHEGQFIDIKEAMERSKGGIHQTFDDHLFDLYFAGKVTKEVALQYAISKNNLFARFQSHVPISAAGEASLKLSRIRSNFKQYRSFRIMRANMESAKERNWVKAMNMAILATFKAKGLEYNKSTPDIDIHYEFNVNDDNALVLEESVNPERQSGFNAGEAKLPIALNIIIKETRTNKEIWGVKSEDYLLVGDLESTSTANRLFIDIFREFPSLI